MQRKKITHILMLLLALLALHTRSAQAFSPAPMDLEIPISGNQAEWLETVCQFMTEGGCAYFTANEADPAWFALKEINAAGTGVRFKQEVAHLTENLELWQVEVTVFPAAGESQRHEVYATFHSQNGSLLLDRIIMFDQTLLTLD